MAYDYLKARFRELGLTHGAVARRLDPPVSEAQVTMWLNGRKIPGARLRELAEIAGTPLGSLVRMMPAADAYRLAPELIECDELLDILAWLHDGTLEARKAALKALLAHRADRSQGIER